MLPYDAVIFDLDGTIADTLADLHAAVNHALAAFNMPLRTIEQTRATVGNGIRNLIMRSMPEGSDQVDEVLASFRAFYKDHLLVNTGVYPGTVELVRELRRNGVKLAVASNKFQAGTQAICEALYPDLIDTIFGESPDRPRKPDPAIVREILRSLDTAPSRAVLVGDSDVDVKTARNAGIDVVAVTWGFRSREQLVAAGADRIVDTAAALKTELLGE